MQSGRDTVASPGQWAHIGTTLRGMCVRLTPECSCDHHGMIHVCEGLASIALRSGSGGRMSQIGFASLALRYGQASDPNVTSDGMGEA